MTDDECCQQLKTILHVNYFLPEYQAAIDYAIARLSASPWRSTATDPPTPGERVILATCDAVNCVAIIDDAPPAEEFGNWSFWMPMPPTPSGKPWGDER